MIMFACFVFTRQSNQVCTLHSEGDLHAKSYITQLSWVNLHMWCTEWSQNDWFFSLKTAGSKRKWNYQWVMIWIFKETEFQYIFMGAPNTKISIKLLTCRGQWASLGVSPFQKANFSCLQKSLPSPTIRELWPIILCYGKDSNFITGRHAYFLVRRDRISPYCLANIVATSAKIRDHHTKLKLACMHSHIPDKGRWMNSHYSLLSKILKVCQIHSFISM